MFKLEIVEHMNLNEKKYQHPTSNVQRWTFDVGRSFFTDILRFDIFLKGGFNNGGFVGHVAGVDGFAEKGFPLGEVHIIQHNVKHKG